MKKLLLLSTFVFACNGANASKLDEPAKPKVNVARDNAMVSNPDAKCDETGFEEPELHSVRCTLKNGVKLYCWAGIVGTDCKPIFAPEEVIKAARDAEAAARAQQATQQATFATSNEAAAKKSTISKK